MKDNLIQGIWSVLEYLSYPIFIFLSTPYFLKTLGITSYGQWMWLVAITGFGGLAGFGIGPATTKEISRLRGSDKLISLSYITRNSVGIAIAGILIITLLFLILIQILPFSWFAKIGSKSEILTLLLFAIIIIFFEQIDSVYTGVIKGFERFDLSAKIEVLSRLFSIILCITVVHLTPKIQVLFSAIVAATILRFFIKGFVASKLVRKFVFLPSYNKEYYFELLNFGKWSWLQSFGSFMFAIMDRLIIGSFLGSNDLAKFSIFTQLTQQIHTLPSAASTILFPMISRSIESNKPYKTIVILAFFLLAALSMIIAILLILFGNSILQFWIPSFELIKDPKLFFILIFAFFLLSLCVVPHHTFFGLNRVKVIALSNIIAGIISATLCIFLVTRFGLLGIAYSKVIYSLIILLSYALFFKLHLK